MEQESMKYQLSKALAYLRYGCSYLPNKQELEEIIETLISQDTLILDKNKLKECIDVDKPLYRTVFGPMIRPDEEKLFVKLKLEQIITFNTCEAFNKAKKDTDLINYLKK